jgi:type IV pilus assembly protein PilM
MLKLVNKSVIGVDIGSHAVKAVQLSKTKGQWSVTSAAIIEVSEKHADSPSRREANTVRAIQDCMRVISPRGRLAVLSLGGPDVAVRSFEFPALPPDEMEKAVLLEAKQVCPFSTPDIVVDYCLLPDGRDRARGYFVAATNKLLKSQMKLSKRAHLNCVLMDVDALALLNCFKETEQPGDNHGTAILNVGGRHATLAIEGNYGRPFVRTLGYSGDEVIKQIAEKTSQTAEEVRRILAGDTKDIPESVNDSLAEASSRLVDEINKTIRYYGAQQNSFEIEKLLVCGGFSLYGRLTKMLSERLVVRVELWNPFEKMLCHTRILRGVLLKKILRQNGPAMAVAAGLAMRSI